MGAILPFVARDTSRKSTKSPAGGEGAIIIFPVVRYERPLKGDDTLPPAKATATREKGPSKH